MCSYIMEQPATCLCVFLCRHDKEGRSNGFYILGYRVYASGNPVASVNGAGSDRVLVNLSSMLTTSCVKVDVR